MSQQLPKWIVRGKDDSHILGPFTLEKISELLDKGVITGEEQVAAYPGGAWTQFSKVPELYDLMLNFLSQDTKTSRVPNAAAVNKEQQIIQSTVTTPPLAVESVSTKPLQKTTAVPQVTRTGLPEKAKIQKSPPKKVNKVLAFLFLVVGAALLFLALEESPKSKRSVQGARLSLINPQFTGKKDFQTSQKLIVEGQGFFYLGGYSNLLQAQEKFVRAVEANNMSGEALAMLLLTDWFLYPFTKQDSQDQATVQNVFQQLTKAEPFGPRKAVGAVAYQLILARDVEVKSVLETGLQESPSESRLYFLKGASLFENSNFIEAKAYFDKATALTPKWIDAFYWSALMSQKANDFSAAAKGYQAILASNPKHSESKLQLGFLEGKWFAHGEKAVSLLREALDSPDRFRPEDEGAAHFILAILLSRSGEMEKAKVEIEKAQKLLPADIEVQAAAAQILGKQGSELAGQDERQFLTLGDQYLRSKDHLAAQAQYKAALKVNPKNVRAYQKAAEALTELNQTSEAIQLLKKALGVDPKDVSSAVLLASIQMKTFDYPGAQSSLELAKKANPRNYEVFKAYAELYLKKGDWAAAEAMSSQALRLYDSDAASNELMARVLLAKNDPSKAQQYAKKAVELDRSNPAALVTYAKTFLAFQNSKAGVEYLTSAINLYPTAIDLRLGLAEVYLNDEQYLAAQQVLEQVIQSNPKNKRARMLLGEAYFQNNDGENALTQFLAAAKLDVANPDGLFKAGEVYLKAGRPSEAQRQFSLVTRANPQFPNAHFNLAKCYLAMSEGDLALKEIEEEKKLNPSGVEAYELAGDIYLQSKKFPQAAKEYQRVTNLRSASGAPIYIKMARAFRGTGNHDAALSMLKLAANKESGLAEIYREQGAIFDIKGQSAEAIASYKQYLVLEPNAADKEQIQGRIKLLE